MQAARGGPWLAWSVYTTSHRCALALHSASSSGSCSEGRPSGGVEREIQVKASLAEAERARCVALQTALLNSLLLTKQRG